MGAWGTGLLENDDALDWLAEFEEDPDVDRIGVAIAAIANDVPDAPACSAALAACEMLAIAKRAGGTRFELQPKTLAALRSMNSAQTSRLTLVAIPAIDRIMAESELKDLWLESGDYAAWNALVEQLHNRLVGSESRPPAHA